MKSKSNYHPESSGGSVESLTQRLEKEIANFANEQKQHSRKFRTELRDQLHTLREQLSLVSQLASVVSTITDREFAEVMDASNIEAPRHLGTAVITGDDADAQLDKQLDKQLANEILTLNEVAGTLTTLFKKRDIASWGREQSLPHLEWLRTANQKITELEQAKDRVDLLPNKLQWAGYENDMTRLLGEDVHFRRGTYEDYREMARVLIDNGADTDGIDLSWMEGHEDD